MLIERLLEEHELMIHSVLREYQIYPTHPDYDDFAQELRIRIFEELKSLLTSKREIKSMEAYLRNATRWKLFKLLRSQKRHQAIPVEDTLLMNQAYIDENLMFKEFVLSLPKDLTPKEQELLWFLYEGYDLSTLAEKYDRQYRTIRRWRDQLIDRLKNDHE